MLEPGGDDTVLGGAGRVAAHRVHRAAVVGGRNVVRIKRFAVSCLLAGSLAAAVVGGAGAAANPQHANCNGQAFSYFGPTGQNGQFISAWARQGGLGPEMRGEGSGSECTGE